MEIATFQMAAVFALIVASLALYATEKVPLEVTSLGVLCGLLVLFYLLPVVGSDGNNTLDAVTLFSGFANPALIAVLALLVVGDALERTGALDQGAAMVLAAGRGSALGTMLMALGAILVVSAVLNNIPVVVIFIPIMQAIALRLGKQPSRLMMPLSFAAMLGGMTTLLGSSTNLLVSSGLVQLGEAPFGFFDFTVPGVVLAAAGLIYLLTVAPYLLPDRQDMASTLTRDSRRFIAQITVTAESKVKGTQFESGRLEAYPDLMILMVQREEHAFLPPFDDIALQPDDVLIVAATRDSLAEVSKADPAALHPRLSDAPEEGGAGPWAGR